MSSNSPASQDEAKSALKALFTAYPAERSNGLGGAATYLMAVDGYSLPAIQKAVLRLIRGEFDWFGGKFLPTTAELSRACRYCEDLLAPPKMLALPAPGDIIDDSPEAIARRQQHAENCRKHRFNWQEGAEGAPVDHVEDFDEWNARRSEDVAAQSKAGGFRLSPEAMGIFAKRPRLSDAEYEKVLEAKQASSSIDASTMKRDAA